MPKKRISNTKPVVLVAQPYTPIEGSHSERVYHLARHLSTRGYSLTIVTIRVGARYPQRGVEDEVLGVNVQRTFPGVFHAIAHGGSHTRLPHTRASLDSSDVSASERPLRHAAVRHLLEGLKSFYQSSAVPDTYADWIPNATLALLKHAAPDSVVISTSMPLSAHLATLAAKTVRNFRWIADFGDPWLLDASRPKRSWSQRLHKVLERSVVQHADALVFTTQRTADDYRAHYGEPVASKIHLARMGFDAEFKPARTSRFARPTVFYGGSITPENRSVAAVLEVANRLNDWDFIFAGQSVKVVADRIKGSRSALPTNVHLIGWLNREDYGRVAAQASASIILGNKNPQQVPGKVYQLIGLGARILYIGAQPQETDEAWNICRPFGHWASNDALSIINALELLQESSYPSLSQSGAQASEYQWDRQLRLFEDLIEVVSENRPRPKK